MHILVISNMFPSDKDPVYGTFVKVFADSISRLNDRGTTTLAVLRGRHKGIAGKLAAYAGFYIRVLCLLLSHRYDMVYVHTITFPIIPIRIAAIFRRQPLVFNLHGTDLVGEARITRLLRRLARPVVSKARGIVVPSEYFRREFLRYIPGFDSSRIHVSPSGGIDTHLFRPEAQPVDGSPKVWNLGFVSRIDEGKGWNLFIEALGRLVEEGIPCHGIIAGRGAQTECMLRLIRDRHLENCIEYIGPVAHDSLPEIYRRFDLFIFPSWRKGESLGLVGIESLACGVPVVTSNMAGPQEYVESGKNGFLFKPCDETDLTEKILQYINLPDSRRKEMATCARRTAEKFDTTAVMRRLYEFLVQLLDK